MADCLARTATLEVAAPEMALIPGGGLQFSGDAEEMMTCTLQLG